MNDFQVPDDPSTLFQSVDSPLWQAVVMLTLIVFDLIVLACSPALVIAVWRWAL